MTPYYCIAATHLDDALAVGASARQSRARRAEVAQCAREHLHIRLQPALLTATAFTTCNCSLDHIRLQPPPRTVAASSTHGCSSSTYGCSLHYIRLQASTSAALAVPPSTQTSTGPSHAAEPRTHRSEVSPAARPTVRRTRLGRGWRGRKSPAASTAACTPCGTEAVTRVERRLHPYVVETLTVCCGGDGDRMWWRL